MICEIGNRYVTNKYAILCLVLSCLHYWFLPILPNDSVSFRVPIYMYPVLLPLHCEANMGFFDQFSNSYSCPNFSLFLSQETEKAPKTNIIFSKMKISPDQAVKGRPLKKILTHSTSSCCLYRIWYLTWTEYPWQCW